MVLAGCLSADHQAGRAIQREGQALDSDNKPMPGL